MTPRLSSVGWGMSELQGVVAEAGQHDGLAITLAEFYSETDNEPKIREMTWGELRERLASHLPLAVKERGSLFSPTKYKPETTRANENVLGLFAAVLDFDHCNVTAIENRLAELGCEAILYTSHSHTDADPHLRAVIPFALPIPRDNWRKHCDVRARIEQWFGVRTDPQTWDESRIYYWPAHKPRAPFSVKHFMGDLIDPMDMPSAAGSNGHSKQDTTKTVTTTRADDEDFEPADAQLIEDGCAWLAHCHQDAVTLQEPEWYAMLGILARCQDGRQLAHEWSRPYRTDRHQYSETETEAKLQHALDAAGPATCKTISLFDTGHCTDCSNRKDESSPIVLGRRYAKPFVGTAPEEWQTPTPFYQTNLPAFPVDILPDWLRRFVEAEAEFTQTPPDLTAAMALTVIAAACAKKVRVVVRDGWSEPVNIYTVCILPPANRKTPVVSAVCRPIEEYEQTEAERVGREIIAAETLKKTAESRLAQAHTRIAKEAKSSQGDNELVTLAIEAANIDVPKSPRLLADDCTPEKLQSLLAEHGGRMALLSAEGDVFDMMAGRYSSTPNFAVFQKGHTGESLRVDRIHRAAEYVPDPALTLGLAVQPDVICGLIEQPRFRGRGLLGRFLYVWPESLLGHRQIRTKPVDPIIYTAYHSQIRNLLHFQGDVDDRGNPLPFDLRLTHEAEETLDEFAGWIEPQLAEGGGLRSIADWAGKLVGHIARLAGLLHLAEHSKGDEGLHKPIDVMTVARAVRLGQYLIPHAQAAFNEMGADEETGLARQLAGWIKRTQADRFSKRDAFRALPGLFKKAERLDRPLRVLMEHGYIRPIERIGKEGPGQKGSPMYEVNPLFLAE